MGNKMWSVATTLAALVGASLAKKLSESIWKKATDERVPENPQDPAVDWGRAVTYAVLSGAIVQIVRLVINRQSARTFIRATGSHPDARA